MRLKHVLMFTALSSLVASTEKLSFNSNDPTQCFVVWERNTTVVVQGTGFSPLRETKSMECTAKIADIELLAYRKRDIVEDHLFPGEYMDLELCVPEAIELGYCQGEDAGRLLYKTWEEGYKPLLYEKFNPLMPQFTENFTVEEAGFYCLKTYSRTAKSYSLMVIIADNRTLPKEREDLVVVFIWKAVACIASLVLLVVAWYGIEKPHTVKWLILTKILTLFTTLWRVYRLSRITFIEDHGFGLKFVDFSGGLWIGLFMFYQLSKGFSHANSRYDSIKLFIIIQFTYAIEFTVLAVNYYKRHISYYITNRGAQALVIAVYTTRTAVQTYLYYRMYKRFCATSKSYTEFNKADHPLLRQFRALFMYKYVVAEIGIFVGVFVLVLVHQQVLAYFTFYRDYFMIDGASHVGDVQRSFLISGAIASFTELYVLWAYWRPQYFKKIEEYKERND